jgi:hypothetical protein
MENQQQTDDIKRWGKKNYKQILSGGTNRNYEMTNVTENPKYFLDNRNRLLMTK